MFTGRHQVREVDVAAVLALCGVIGAPRERMLRLELVTKWIME
jgi:hypothetical protein